MTVIKCNKCGKEFDDWDKQENFIFQHKAGYGSKYDCSEIDLALCCDCFDEIMTYIESKCLISPVKECGM